MNYSIKIKRTDEITCEEWNRYVAMFNEIFHREYTRSDFEKKYLSGSGYSLHSFLYADDLLVGSQSYVLETLLYKRQERLFACGCDTFIAKKYRKKYDSLENMHRTALPVLKERGVTAIIGEPHPQMFEYLSACGLAEAIGHISNFVLPVNPLCGQKFWQKLCNFGVRRSIMLLLPLLLFNKRKLYRGDELFQPAKYYTPSAYFTQEIDMGNGIRLNYYISSKNHIIIVHDNFESVKDFVTGVIFLLWKYKYAVRAVEYRTACSFPFPFIRYNQIGLFSGLIIADDLPRGDFYSLENWQFKRGYFD